MRYICSYHTSTSMHDASIHSKALGNKSSISHNFPTCLIHNPKWEPWFSQIFFQTIIHIIDRESFLPLWFVSHLCLKPYEECYFRSGKNRINYLSEPRLVFIMKFKVFILSPLHLNWINPIHIPLHISPKCSLSQ